MAVAMGWMIWILYQLDPPPLVMKAAYDAFASANAKTPQNTVTGAIAASVEPAKPAAEIPTPVAAKPNPAEIVDTIEAWARAWSSKDVPAYLAFYAANFQTPGGEPRAEWENMRRQRISAPKNIEITVESPTLTVVSEGLVNVTFRQGYRSDIITSAPVTKVLVLVKTDGRWLIQSETAT
jgi:ketosteroid isomerase-like protein